MLKKNFWVPVLFFCSTGGLSAADVLAVTLNGNTFPDSGDVIGYELIVTSNRGTLDYTGSGGALRGLGGSSGVLTITHRSSDRFCAWRKSGKFRF